MSFGFETSTSRPWYTRAGTACLAAVLATGEVRAQDAPEPTGADSMNPSSVSVTDRGRVQLHVADMPLSDVLRLLSLEGKRNIVASPQVQGTVTANLYDVTFDEALKAILVANGAGYITTDHFIYVYTQAQLAEMKQAAAGKPVTRVFRLSYISAQDAESFLTPLLAGTGQVSSGSSVTASPRAESGIASSSDEAGGDTYAAGELVVVTAPMEKMAAVENVLREVDVRPRQVLIEATILRAELRNDNALGIDFSIVGGVDLEQLGAVSNAIQDVSLGQLPVERYELFNAAASTNFRKDVPAGGISVGIIKDQVAVFLRALEQVTDTTVLANPKVLALNKQKGQVIVGRRDGFLTTTFTETQAIQSVEYLETGTRLLFRPYIGEDGYVRIELHPEDSVGFVNAQGLPSKQTTEVTTNVLVRDSQTILIGGLFREVTTDARNQVPLLGGIPGLGQLFRSNNDTTQREEVIILLTVHIVKDQSTYAANSVDALDQGERIRVGLRQGMMWHGRDRLAQSQYQRAVEAQALGDTGKALWHLDLALRNDRRLLPAILLKEQITGERAWDDEGANVRDFARRLIAQDRGADQHFYGRPAWNTPNPEQIPSTEGESTP